MTKKLPPNMRRLSMDLDVEFHRRVKRLAVERDVTMLDLIRRWLAAGLAKEEAAAKGKAAAA
jgi:hypothetical protein